MILCGTPEKYEYLGENKNQTILTHWSVAQADLNDENNRGLKILLDSPFKRQSHKTRERFSGVQRIDKELKINFNGVFIIIFWWKTRVGNLLIEFRISNFAQKEWVKLLLFLKTYKKTVTNFPKNTFFQILLSKLLIFCEQKRKWVICSKKLCHSLIRSFVLSNLSESLTFAHLSWKTSVIRSESLICPVRPQRIAHICSFVLRNLSEWVNSQPCEKHQLYSFGKLLCTWGRGGSVFIYILKNTFFLTLS